MKKKTVWILCTAVVVMIVSAWLFTKLPDRVPVHFDFDGTPNRYGSRWETLLVPVFSVGMLAYAGVCAQFGEEQKSKTQATISWATGTAIGVFSWWIMWKTSSAVQKAAATGTVRLQEGMWPCLIIGVLLAVVSNILPRLSRNRLFGLRTKWSLSSDVAWQKTQRFSALLGTLIGVLLILCAFLTKGKVRSFVPLTGLLIWVIAGMAASYRYAKQDERERGEGDAQG